MNRILHVMCILCWVALATGCPHKATPSHETRQPLVEQPEFVATISARGFKVDEAYQETLLRRRGRCPGLDQERCAEVYRIVFEDCLQGQHCFHTIRSVAQDCSTRIGAIVHRWARDNKTVIVKDKVVENKVLILLERADMRVEISYNHLIQKQLAHLSVKPFLAGSVRAVLDPMLESLKTDLIRALYCAETTV